jgi:predicted kinase
MRVCYKRYMRKWMRERITRRKKGDGPAPKEQANAPVPLQPKYFEASEAAPEAEPVSAPRDSEPDHEPQVDNDSQAVMLAASEGRTEGRSTSRAPDGRPSRRRRGRGGRGRGARPKPAETTAQARTSPPDGDAAPSRATPAVAAPAAPAQPSKGTVVLAIGLPGSGKSSWFKRHNIRPLSSDLLRELLFDDATEQRFQDLVFSNLRSMLKARLVARRPVNYVDATNLTPHDRQSWIKLAKDYGYDVQGLYFDVPVETCLERNQRRERVVAEDIMRKMAAKLKAPAFEEGFSKITVVRVKQKEDADSNSAG